MCFLSGPSWISARWLLLWECLIGLPSVTSKKWWPWVFCARSPGGRGTVSIGQTRSCRPLKDRWGRNRMDKYGFKDTPLGPMPMDWEIVRVGELFQQVYVRVKDLAKESEKIPVLSMTRYGGLVLQSKKFDKRVASRDTRNYKVVRKGQLVYSFPIDEGVIAILHRYPIGAVSPAYHVWEMRRNIDPIYLDLLLKTPLMVNQYKRRMSHVVQRRRNLSPKDFADVPIPLPPLPEQRAIAHVLSTVRQSIEATDRVIAAARQLKRSLMKHLFTYGPVWVEEAERVLLEETEIGEVPDTWQILSLGELCDFTTGKLDSNKAVLGGRYPFFTCSRETLQI